MVLFLSKFHVYSHWSPCYIFVDTNIRILHSEGPTAGYIILVTSLFHAVTCRIYVTSKTWLLGEEGGGAGEETLVAPCKVLSWLATGRAEEKYGKINSRCPVMVFVYKANNLFNSLFLVVVPNSITFRPCECVRLFLISLILL